MARNKTTLNLQAELPEVRSTDFNLFYKPEAEPIDKSVSLFAKTIQNFVNGAGTAMVINAEKKVKKSDEPWVDLLKQVNLGSANAGDWQWQDEELHTDASTASRIALPFRPTGEYDFRITFTRHTGNDSIALIFVAGTAQATFEIDAWRKNLAGIQSIDDETIETNSTRVENQALRNGQKYAAEVRIRADRVEAYLDGTHLTTYHGNGSNLGMPIGWRLFNDRTSLGIGAWDSSTTFHSVEIRTLSGPH